MAIGARFTKWDSLQSGPYLPLKGGAARCQLDRETLPFAAEKLGDLLTGSCSKLRVADEFVGLETAAQPGLAAKSRRNDSAALI